jgi:hypothetical protein
MAFSASLAIFEMGSGPSRAGGYDPRIANAGIGNSRIAISIIAIPDPMLCCNFTVELAIVELAIVELANVELAIVELAILELAI